MTSTLTEEAARKVLAETYEWGSRRRLDLLKPEYEPDRSERRAIRAMLAFAAQQSQAQADREAALIHAIRELRRTVGYYRDSDARLAVERTADSILAAQALTEAQSKEEFA